MDIPGTATQFKPTAISVLEAAPFSVTLFVVRRADRAEWGIVLLGGNFWFIG